MKENQSAPLANPFGAVSEMWMSAWLQPWSAWQSWAEFWTGPWQSWLDGIAAAPTTWLPALAGERRDQPAKIDFFLPWLPHVEALVKPLQGAMGEDAMRVMLRAALPPLASFGTSDWLMVDAVVSKKPAKAEVPALAPAVQAVTAEAAQPAALAADPVPAKLRSPAKRGAEGEAAAPAPVVKTPAQKTAAAPRAAAKRSASKASATAPKAAAPSPTAAKAEAPRGRRKAKPAAEGPRKGETPAG